MHVCYLHPHRNLFSDSSACLRLFLRQLIAQNADNVAKGRQRSRSRSQFSISHFPLSILHSLSFICHLSISPLSQPIFSWPKANVSLPWAAHKLIDIYGDDFPSPGEIPRARRNREKKKKWKAKTTLPQVYFYTCMEFSICQRRHLIDTSGLFLVFPHFHPKSSVLFLYSRIFVRNRGVSGFSFFLYSKICLDGAFLVHWSTGGLSANKLAGNYFQTLLVLINYLIKYI